MTVASVQAIKICLLKSERLYDDELVCELGQIESEKVTWKL